MTVAYPIRIYADIGCPLCGAELRGLQARDQHGRLQVVDCSATGFADAHTRLAGLDAEQLMACIHAQDAEGRWLRGIAVFPAAYAAAGFTRFAPVFEHCYPWVARHRTRLSGFGLPALLGWLLARGKP